MTEAPATHPVEVQKNSGATYSAAGEHYLLGVNAVVGEPLLCQVRCMPTPCQKFPWRVSSAATTNVPKRKCCDEHKLETAGESYEYGPYDARDECHVVRSIRTKWRSAKDTGILFTLEEITKVINSLEETKWIDEFTRQIMLKLVVYLPHTDQYACNFACTHTHTYARPPARAHTRTQARTHARVHVQLHNFQDGVQGQPWRNHYTQCQV